MIQQRWLESRTKGFAAVFFVAAAVRILYFWHQLENPFNAFPISDSLFYVSEAMKVMSGDWLGDEVFSRGGTAFYRYFLAIFFSLFGKNYLAVAAVQHLMGALTCGLIYLTADRLYGAVIALFIGVWSAFFAPFLFHEGVMLTSAPALLFLVLSLYLHFRSLESGKNLSALGAGFTFGLATLCRPNLLLLAPLYLLWWILSKKRGEAFRTAALYACLIGMALAILPVTARNYAVGNDLVLVTSGGGLNFYMGNNPEATGVFFVPTKTGLRNDTTLYVSSREVAEKDVGRTLKASEVSRYWFGRGLDFIVDSPGRAAELFLTKFVLFWNTWEASDIYDYYFFQRYSPLLANPLGSYAFLSAFGLLGAFLALFSGTLRERFLPAALFTYMMSVLLFFVFSRLRLPVAPFLFLSAGVVLKKIQTSNGAARGGMAIVCIALFLFCQQELDEKMKRSMMPSEAKGFYRLGQRFIQSSDYIKAKALFDLAVRDAPGNPVFRFQAGLAAEMTGDTDAARSSYLKVIENTPVKSNETPPLSVPIDNDRMARYSALTRMGVLSLNEGAIVAAEGYLEEAVKGDPKGLDAYLYLGFAFERGGKIKEAIDIYEAYLLRAPEASRVRERRSMLVRQLDNNRRVK